MKPSIGVIGASGRLGLELLSLAKAKKYDTVATSSNVKSPHVTLNLINTLDFQLLDSLFAECSSIVYLPGLRENSKPIEGNSWALNRVNFGARDEVSQWVLSRGKHLVFVSGAIVYKNLSQNLLDEESELGINGLSESYARTKIMGENIVHGYGLSGLNNTVIRPSSIFGGKSSKSGLIERFVHQSVFWDYIEVSPPLQQKIGFIHAKEVASCIIYVIEHRLFDTYNVSSVEMPSVGEIAEIFSQISGKPLRIGEFGHLGLQSEDRFLLDLRNIANKGWLPKFSLNYYFRLEYMNKLNEAP